jgi:hypothetical protein
MKHEVIYKKWTSKENPDISLRFFYTFDDRPEFVGKYVLKTHSTKEYTVIPAKLINVDTMYLFNEVQEIIGYYENKKYVKITDGVKVIEPPHKNYNKNKQDTKVADDVKVTEPTQQSKKGKDMTNTDTIFWMVYGTDKGTPKHKHYTQYSATSEAKRLSLVNPGVTFYVLKSVDAYIVSLPEPQKVELSYPLQNL